MKLEIRTNERGNSEWDVYVDFDYNGSYKTNSTKTHQPIKVRVVNYKWRDESGYINEGWNCRKMVNITSDTTGNGVVEIGDFSVTTSNDIEWPNTICKILNCTRELRIAEVLGNGSVQKISFLNISNEKYNSFSPPYCLSANISFNTSLISGQPKQFFVYSTNPLAEVDYQPPTGPGIFNGSYDTPLNDTVWDGLFISSHIDIWWWNDTDPLIEDDQKISRYDRRDANKTCNTLKELGYIPQVSANRPYDLLSESLSTDTIYFYSGHGGINYSTPPNETDFYLEPSEPIHVRASQISDLPIDITAKFVMMISSYGGDNSTTLNGCPLTYWLSDAFTNRTPYGGAECYLSFLGDDEITNCPTGCSSCPDDMDMITTTKFNTCFWNKILEDPNTVTIKNARDYAESDISCIWFFDAKSRLVNSTIDGCEQTLAR